MSATTIQYQQTRMETLQREYERAWRQFTAAVDVLRAVENDPSQERAFVSAAADRATRANNDYRVARDAFATYLMEQQDGKDSDVREPALACSRV